MSFWSTFYKQSLGSPWVIRDDQTPDGRAVPQPAAIVFWAPQGAEGGPLHQMMERMVAAIGMSAEDVSMEFSAWNSSLVPESVERVLVFDGGKPKGIFETRGIAQVMHTFPLDKIAGDKTIKAQAWAHLKKFGGLS